MNLKQPTTRGWVTIGVPGTEHSEYSTYVMYDWDRLPPVPRALGEGDGFGWLRELPEVGNGMAPDGFGHVTTPLSADGVQSLLQDAGLPTPVDILPGDLRVFVSEPGLHRRLFSATDAYVDAGQHLHPVPGGHLLHLASDSQWVCHWLAYLGNDGATGVVCPPGRPRL